MAGKIKAMRDFHGDELTEAGPSTPVKILGLKQLPEVGDILEVTQDRKKVKEMIRDNRIQKPDLPVTEVKSKEQEEEEEDEGVPTLTVILKTDVLGSQEALLEALEKFKDPEVHLKIIKKGLGNVTDVDVFDAQAAKATILAYRVKAVPSAEESARDNQIEILYFDIIYKLLEEVEARLKKLLTPQVIRTELGKVQVLAIFKVSKNGMIVGGKVIEGKVKKDTKVKVIRNGETVTIGDLTSLQAAKQEVTEVVKGEDCGLEFKGREAIQENDILEVYQEEVQARELGKN